MTRTVRADGGDAAERIIWNFEATDPSIAHRSRREIAERLGTLAGRDQMALADCELIIGELLANIVEHAPGPVCVELERRGDDLVLSVSDCGPGLVAEPRVTAPEGLVEDGRGLFLVRRLSRDLRFGRSLRGGALVTVVLPLRVR